MKYIQLMLNVWRTTAVRKPYFWLLISLFVVIVLLVWQQAGVWAAVGTAVFMGALTIVLTILAYRNYLNRGEDK